MRSITVRPPGKPAFLDFRCGFNIRRWTGSLVCDARIFFKTAVIRRWTGSLVCDARIFSETSVIWRWTGSLVCNARIFFKTAVAIVAGYDQENKQRYKRDQKW